ncbi:MAG: tryptophan 2,3-dioxygenase family protein [Myxococcota bacterium]
MEQAPTYWDYLELDRLLQLQGGLEHDDRAMLADELHFIVVHQTYELWFKLVLRCLRIGRDALGAPRVAEEAIPTVVHYLRRVNAILDLGTAQFAVMETMTPQGFLDFRDKLVPASGFQSFQLRELEILIGLDDADRVRLGNVDPLSHIEQAALDTPAGRLAKARITAARSERTVRDCLDDWLFRTPIQGSSPGDPDDDAAVAGFLSEYLGRMDQNHELALGRMLAILGGADPAPLHKRFTTMRDQARAFLNGEDVPEPLRARRRRIRAGALFIESYRELPLLSWPRLLLDTVVELEEQFVLFRHRHARMVERMIGRRVGTGGSGGVEYLDKTTEYRMFRDLWAIRTVLLPKSEVPALRNPAFYGFSAAR